MEDLPGLMRSERAKRKWDQEGASALLNWTFYRYRRVELGKERATDAEVSQIAALFGLSERLVKRARAKTKVSVIGASL